MIAACKSALREQLIDASVPAAAIFTEAAAARGHQGRLSALILTGPHTLTPDGTVVGAWVSDDEETKTIRRRTHVQAVQFAVVLTAASEAAASAIIDQVTQGIGKGFRDGELETSNHIRAGRVTPGWLDYHEQGRTPGASRSSLLAGTTGVIAGFNFVGGLYVDRTDPVVADVRPEASVP